MSGTFHLQILDDAVCKKQYLQNPKMTDTISKIMELYELTIHEATLFMVIFKKSASETGSICAFDLKEELHLSDSEYFELYQVIRGLSQKRMIKSECPEDTSELYPKVSIPQNIYRLVPNEEPLYAKADFEDANKLIFHISELIDQREDNSIDLESYYLTIRRFMEKAKDALPLCGELLKLPDDELSLILYAIAIPEIKGQKGTLNDYIDKVHNAEHAEIAQKVRNKELKQAEFDLVILTEARQSDIIIRPSATTLSRWFGEKYFTRKYRKVDFTSLHSVLEYFTSLLKEHDTDNDRELRCSVSELLSLMSDTLPLKKYAQQLQFTESVLLLECAYDAITEDDGVNLKHFYTNIYGYDGGLLMCKDFECGDSTILKDKMVVSEEVNGFFSTAIIVRLSRAGAKKLLGVAQKYAVKPSNLVKIVPHKRKADPLYFSGRLEKDIDILSHALSQKNYKKLCQQMKAHNMPSGFVCLFYGAPGTGKTAVAQEIARICKRDIVQVDISAIRDKYVGESEKQLKKVFTDYQSVKEDSETTPILLFNEADAILGKRIHVTDSVDQMSNAMQNILLEELENFNGIFMATTNLSEHLDTAFSRRFTYKVQFDKPNAANRLLIWKKYLKTLSESELEKASSFDLSGGQIANVAKRFIVESFIKGHSMELLMNMIESETNFNKGKGHAGFVTW